MNPKPASMFAFSRRSCKTDGRHPHISAEYDGDNPLRLAEEIDAALDKSGLGNDRRLLTSIKFFEGELRLIADCLRCTGAQKVAKLPRSNVGGVDTRLRVVSRR